MSRTILRYRLEGSVVVELEEERGGVWIRFYRPHARACLGEVFLRRRELAGIRHRLEEVRALPCLKQLRSSQS